MMIVAMSTALIAMALRSARVILVVMRAEQHGGVDRADDGKEGGEGGQKGFEHGYGQGSCGRRTLASLAVKHDAEALRQGRCSQRKHRIKMPENTTEEARQAWEWVIFVKARTGAIAANC